VYLWMSQCGNVVLLTIRFLNVAKFTTLTPLSLLIASGLSFPIVGLKNTFSTYFYMKTPNIIIVLYLGN
jgi:hypothetical protein